VEPPTKKQRGCIWWVGVATIGVIVLFVGLFVWGEIFVWNVSAADKTAAEKAVAAAAHTDPQAASCVNSHPVSCLVQLRRAGSCEEWTVQVRKGAAVSKPRRLATLAC
jgi:hypothetical protein